MHHTLCVRVAESVCNISKDRHRFDKWDRIGILKPLAKRGSVHKRHGVVQQAIVGACRKNWNYVRMLKTRRELYFALEAFDLYSGGKVGREKLYDYLTSQLNVARDKHAAHSSAAELSQDFVFASQSPL